EQIAFLLGREAVQRQRVLAHDQVREQSRGFADTGHVAQRLRRDRQPVADAAAQDDDVIAAADRDLALDERDHAVAFASAACSGAPLAWQMATASASAA